MEVLQSLNVSGQSKWMASDVFASDVLRNTYQLGQGFPTEETAENCKFKIYREPGYMVNCPVRFYFYAITTIPERGGLVQIECCRDE